METERREPLGSLRVRSDSSRRAAKRPIPQIEKTNLDVICYASRVEVRSVPGAA